MVTSSFGDIIRNLIIFIFLSGNFSYALATGCGGTVISCKLERKGFFVGFINEKPVRTLEKVKAKRGDKEELRETLFDESIQCSYDIKNLSGYDPNKVYKLYSNICVNLRDEFKYIFNGGTRCKSLPVAETLQDGTWKTTETKRSSLGYIWQTGECSLKSEKYFQKLKDRASVAKLIENKFLLVSQDDSYLVYYANPGYVVKLEKNEKKCKNNKKCELDIILKRRLNSAILDDKGILHTNEIIL